MKVDMDSKYSEYIHILTNLLYSFQRLEGASGLLTKPLHMATQGWGNKA